MPYIVLLTFICKYVVSLCSRLWLSWRHWVGGEGGSGGLDGSCSSFLALMKSTTIVLRSLAMSSGMCSSLLLSSYCRPGSHNWSGVYSGPFLLGLAALFYCWCSLSPVVPPPASLSSFIGDVSWLLPQLSSFVDALDLLPGGFFKVTYQTMSKQKCTKQMFRGLRLFWGASVCREIIL